MIIGTIKHKNRLCSVQLLSGFLMSFEWLPPSNTFMQGLSLPLHCSKKNNIINGFSFQCRYNFDYWIRFVYPRETFCCIYGLRLTFIRMFDFHHNFRRGTWNTVVAWLSGSYDRNMNCVSNIEKNHPLNVSLSKILLATSWLSEGYSYCLDWAPCVLNACIGSAHEGAFMKPMSAEALCLSQRNRCFNELISVELSPLKFLFGVLLAFDCGWCQI